MDSLVVADRDRSGETSQWETSMGLSMGPLWETPLGASAASSGANRLSMSR
jgi:hypothetical protein